MRSKSRFTTLVLLETRESYLQIRVQSLCTLRGHCRQAPRNIRYQAGATPYSDRSSTGWIAPACLAHSFDHLVGAGEQRLRGGDARPSIPPTLLLPYRLLCSVQELSAFSHCLTRSLFIHWCFCSCRACGRSRINKISS